RDPALWHLPPTDQRRPLNYSDATKPNPVKAAQRVLRTERGQIARGAAEELDTALASFFAEVYTGGEEIKRVHVLKAPTGAGKTTRTMSYIAGDPRTFVGGGLTPPDDAEGVGPILFLLPTYNNIDELRA